MKNSNRRDFLKQSLALAGGLGAGMESTPAVQAADDVPRNGRPKFRYLGWQVGLSYQTPRPEGTRP